MRVQKSNKLYPHPFSKAYWRDAAAELKDTKMLVVAALMIALRVAMKGLAIPLAPSLKINTAFFVNALGAMIYGPVLAGLGAAVSDVLGFMLWPQDGFYFPPFMLTEIAGSMIFAMFLYRAKVTPTRVMLSRFCICFFVNVVLQTPIMIWYYSIYLPGKSYMLTIPGIVKNLFMFPIESVVLTLFLSVVLPITNRMKLTYSVGSTEKVMKFTKKQIILLVVLVLLGCASVFGYLTYHYDNTSLSASYSDTERVEKNKLMQTLVLQESDEYDDVATVTIVEAANKPFLSDKITYTAAVYTVNGELTEEQETKAWGYSKSKAKKDENLTRSATATIVVDGDGKVVSFVLDPAN